MNRMIRLTSLAALIAFATPALAQSLDATLYKSPECGCCEGYVAYLRDNGFKVDVKETDELAAISHKAGVPEDMQGCHTTFIDGYVIDGHVPINVVRKLLKEKPAIAGITLPGMPMGSPGMSGTKTEKFVIYTVPKDGKAPEVYATE
ncbi:MULTISPECIES: DUF411 domain-containing protein [unclassified Sinorhizobium]|uniref:DUF411 domain-containing protein n=1 Tax=unclassified Sinorhizobium TaxID=2613772 RepID=UPI0024C40A0D|nr:MULTISPECIES: DUF411 domain-containing protein [unclassified Sinorhizobium]MDK1373401.1 DUF411 domain-containing protein [Sinorhizobium sp. 6-70]MDK1482834.1 DUF411 domain-containing protein [Sinorhizobium sp. 6-117]